MANISNRELSIAQRQREKGLPFSPSDLATPFTLGKKPPKGDPRFTITEDTVLRQDLEKQQGITATPFPPLGQIRELKPEIMKKLALKTTPKAVDGVDKDVSTGIPSLDTFQGKPIPEDVGLPSNVTVLPKRITRPSPRGVSSFGLPTDRLPSFKELGGAIGQMFRFIGGLTKKRQALGLIPGKVNIPTQAKGLSLTDKDTATILAKRLDDITLTDDERTSIKARLDAILNPKKAGEASDIEAIINE